MAAGLAQLDQMAQTLRESKKGSAEARSLDDIKALWEELSGEVGKVTHQPDTNKRSKAQLMAAIAKARTGQPERRLRRTRKAARAMRRSSCARW